MKIKINPIFNWKMPPRFVQRVAMENCWDLKKAESGIDEYKKFMILAAISPTPVTPSDEVDQIWHLHIVHMKNYSDFCKILGKDIIHGPTEGGEVEDARYLDQYQYTLKFYKETFSEPPLEFWPSPTDRFNGIFGRVNFNDHLVIKCSDFPFLSSLFSKILKFNLKMRSLFLLFLLLSGVLNAANVIPRPDVKVWDPDNILTQSQEFQISKISEIDGLDVMVVTVKDLTPYESASSYAQDLYKEWKLGSSSNRNGLLIVAAQKAPHSNDQRDLCRIMTGWDTMEFLPDSVVIYKIKHEKMMIHLPQKPFEAVLGALDGVIENIKKPEEVKAESEGVHWAWWFLGGILVFFVILIIWAANSSSGSGYHSRSSSSSSSSSSSCGSAGCGGGGCGGGGCGGGGCGS
jgi:hypothetical protein